MAILEMNSITKSFGGTKVLDQVNFTVEQGEIHALLGENGAGKSTLMNILTGVIMMDSGTITFNDCVYPLPSIKIMEAAGIAFVHQELNVINYLTVYENLFLNREVLNKFGFLDKKKMILETEKLFDELGVNINPLAMVSELKTSEKQLLEICRALYADAKLLILDEPTTALSNSEIEHLFGILRHLKESGKTFIFISHKLPEVLEIADRYTVLRNGRLVRDGMTSETDANELTTLMVGEHFLGEDLYKPRTLGETVLELKNYTGTGFRDVSFSVRKGEILAFTGLAGCGASELMQTMFGVVPATGGSFVVKGKSMRGRIIGFMRSGIAMLPSDRKENSVIPDMNILENTYVAEHSLSGRRPVISEAAEQKRFSDLKEILHIKTENSADPVTSLSGGNQQKVFLARWLNTGADVLLFDNPTQGVDVGAKAEIYRLILEFAENGKTVVFNSNEIPEIMKLSDRCIVFYEGQIAKIFEHNEINERNIMLYSTNAAEVVS